MITSKMRRDSVKSAPNGFELDIEMSTRLRGLFEIEVTPGCPACKKLPNFNQLWQEYFKGDPEQALSAFAHTGTVEFYLPSLGTDACARIKFFPRTARLQKVRA